MRRVVVPAVVGVVLVAGLGVAASRLPFGGADTATIAAAVDPGGSADSEDATDAAAAGSSAEPADVTPQRAGPSAETVVEAKPTKADKQRDKMTEFKEKVARELARMPAQAEPSDTASFKIGTYNILGSNHAPNGRGRAATSAGFITSRGVDLIGLQEVQRDQQGVFEANMPGYAFWPDGALGRQDYRKQIAWRTSMFEFVDGGAAYYTFTSMPGIPMPWVRLRHLASGAEFYIINNHNSARDLEGERDASTGIAIDLIQELRASGLPVFIVGDMNEHTEFFCRVAQATGMVGANGGNGSGGCTLPPPPLRVDWIMGVGASFSGYVQDGASISSGASDHYFLHADTSIDVVREPESARPD
jgi:endonuclease/exonuclease/phosphatase family metal-dependent hydrolase